jgi:glycosyltransferase involved in cell wall biosynthesis
VEASRAAVSDAPELMASNRIRVLMLLKWLPTHAGGAERFAVGLATNLPTDRYEIVLCTTRSAEGELLEQIRAAGVEHIGLERRNRADLLPWIRFTRMLRRRSFDVLHAHMFGSNVWGTVWGRLAGVPVVVAHEQTWSYQGDPLRRALDRELIGRFADAFVAVSTRDMERMIEVEGVARGKIVVIPNAYIPRASVANTDLREELGIGRDVPLVGTAAVMRPQKALHVLLDAFARVSTALPQAQLVIAGDGPLRADLEAQARDLNIAGRVRFLGYRTDVASLLDAMDVAVMSSDYEGSPLFAFETMAQGTPLVSTDVGAVRDVLEHGESVMLVPPRDPVSLSTAVEALLRYPGLRRSMGRAAARRLSDFEMPVIAARFADLYESLLATKGQPIPQR